MLVAALATACTAVTDVGTTPPPQPTPIIVYVTASPPPATPTVTATPSLTPSPTPTPTPTLRLTPTLLGGLLQGCLDLVMPLYSKLDDLDTRLDLGLNFTNYSSYLSDIVVAAKLVTAAAVEVYGRGCAQLSVYVLTAELDYVDAYDKWNKCISRLSCSNADVTPKLQDDWSKASDQLTMARQQFGL